ncbi:DUF2628 domain-containing protein [Aquibium oceanicum]|uniref:DUF2628 domain-containing protein n=1 Tax=Aquibium oceanicum TaxID=1670800 RepID=A0A1L3SLV0_9HYPH|nr:DUF2628 domain-containing protein [Aquibium oceanicum]APH70292.1 hypothetical protein BSQ44_02005 [Aquibium oceanicum]
MAIYVVMEPPRSRPDSDPVYVRDGYSLFAFLLPLVWLLWNRLWIETLVFLAITLGLGYLGEQAGAAEVAVAGFSILLAIFIGIEGAVFRLWAMRRRGWTEWGVVEAHDREDAEARYVSESLAPAEKPVLAVPMRPGAPQPRGTDTGAPELGLFGYPGRN